MSKLHLIVAFILFSSLSFAQTNMYWNHHSLYNPGASGAEYQHDFSSTTTFKKDVYWGELANYNFRVKPLHGAIGLNIASIVPNEGGGLGYPTLNYTFLVPAKSGGMFGFGAALGLDHLLVNSVSYPSFSYVEDALVLGTGFHFSSKGFNTGVSGRMFPKYVQKYDVSAMSGAFYVNYIWNITEGFGIQPGILISDIYEDIKQLSLRVIALKKFWAGGSIAENTYGFMAGVNFNENFSLGFSLEVDNYYANKTYYEQTGNSRIIRNSLNFRIRFPEKGQEK